MSDGNLPPDFSIEGSRWPGRGLLDGLLRQLPYGVLAIEASTGRVLLANRRLEELLGKKLDPAVRFAAPEDFAFFQGRRPGGSRVQPHEWPLARSLFEGEDVEGEEVEWVRGDGTLVALRMSSAAIHDPDGRRVAAMGLVLDLSERRRAEARAAREHAAGSAATARAEIEVRERLMSVVGHDVRSPLNVITTCAYLLLRKGGLTEEQGQGLERIDRAARRMARMIGDLLDYSRTRAEGGLPVEPREAELGALVRRAVEELRPGFPARDVELRFEGDLWGQWDPDRLKQVVSKLVRSGLEHGDGSGAVRAVARAEGEEVVLEVQHPGPPIPSDQLPTLFEPFYRPGRAEGSSVSGRGLALYLVREIVRAHGGSVALAGTVFTVRLPRYR